MSPRELGLLSVALTFAGCGSNTELDVSVDLPSSIAGDVAWIEVAAFQGGSCDALTPSASAIPRPAAAAYAVLKNNGTQSTLGPLDGGVVAIVATAKSESCEVMGTACREIDLSDSSSVTLAFSAVEEPIPTCGSRGTCNHGRCVAAHPETTVGQDCSLVLVGQGSLGTPFGIDRTRIGSPSIARTEEGFLIAYREFDTSLGAARLSLLGIDANGAIQHTSRSTLPDRCVTAVESDPVGLAWAGKRGLIALARKSCGAALGGLDLFQVDARGTIQSFVFNPTPDSSPDISLSPSHAVSAAGDSAWLAFREGERARVASSSLDGNLGPGTTVSESASGIWIAGGTSVGAMLVADLSGQTHLFIGDRTVSPSSWTPALSTEGIRGNVAVSGTTVAALSESLAGVTLAAFTNTSSAGTLFLTTGSPPLGEDVAIADDAAFVFVQQKANLSLSVVTALTSASPKIRETFVFTNEPRIRVSRTLKDGQIAVSASRDRVAVAWTSANDIDLEEAVGGYAVFACESR